MPKPGLAGTFGGCWTFPDDGQRERDTMFKGGLLWLIGIPIPIILILWFTGYL
jgi:hypothetical protein